VIAGHMTGAAIRDRLLRWRDAAAAASRRVAALDHRVKGVTLSSGSRSGGGLAGRFGALVRRDHVNSGSRREKLIGTTPLRTSLQQAKDAFHLPGSRAALPANTGREDPSRSLSAHADRAPDIKQVVARELRKVLRR
jgi:hypothetical protein